MCVLNKKKRLNFRVNTIKYLKKPKILPKNYEIRYTRYPFFILDSLGLTDSFLPT